MSLDLDLAAALARADPAPAPLCRAASHSFRLRLRSSEVLALLTDTEGGPVPAGRRRLTFGAGAVVVVIDLARSGREMTVAGVVEPGRPGHARLRSIRYEAAIDLSAGVLAAGAFPSSPFSVAVEFLDGPRVHTDWVLP